jgi:hypothetical protein
VVGFQILCDSEWSTDLHDGIQTEQSQHSAQVSGCRLVVGITQTLDSLQSIARCDEVGVLVGHPDQVNLECLVKLLPGTVVFVLWISKHLQTV